ncbi:MAG: dihydrofolate reductase family protein [Chloroflexi bacterium]|nr:dihydrofolate reductase family protein [Chloroflexota bacterium]OJV99214.1 MAG: deaminase [Chloroflexi bacterium 54-19]
MSKLIYFMGMSLDGFVAGENDSLDWSAPDEEVSAFINELHRPIGTYLYGRKNYETMTVWETPEVIPGLSPASMDFAQIWQTANKVVYSRSLETVSTPNTRLEREFEPQVVNELKAQLPHDISVAGPHLAAQAIRAGLVDEIHLLVVPFILGGGKPVLPRDIRIKLELLDERRLGNGWVYFRYRIHD